MNWVIWSEEHGAWWAPGGDGYTRSLNEAGRYTEELARRICHEANEFCEAGEWKECSLPDPLPAELRKAAQ